MSDDCAHQIIPAFHRVIPANAGISVWLDASQGNRDSRFRGNDTVDGCWL
jgi:hypothetical protein